MRQRSLV